METAQIAKALDGDSLYQERARAALPLLVRQAHAGAKIYYSDLAAELGMPNPRNLNFPLGSIGNALRDLAKEWDEPIPMIQCIVVNKKEELPGEGITDFVRDQGEFKSLSRRKRQLLIDSVLSRVYSYPRWNEVLSALNLAPVATSFAEQVEAAAHFASGGESKFHEALKTHVANNPAIVGLPDSAKPGAVEYPLPSGDSVDVLFRWKGERLAVEVKSRISPSADIVRGLFQCVKYRAVLNAQIAAENCDEVAQAVLVLEGSLPPELCSLRNVLDVRVIENVAVGS